MAWTNNVGDTALFADPANGGTGFLGWTSSKSASPNSGYSLGDSTVGAGNVNVNGNAFIVYGHTGENASAYRKLINSLDQIGDSFSVRFSVNFRNGEKGVIIYDSTGQTIYGFRVIGDAYEYYTAPTSWVLLGAGDWPYSPNGEYTLLAVKEDATNTRITTSRNDGPTSSVLINTSDLNEIAFYCQNTTGAGVAQDNLYFNQLSSFNGYRS